MGPPLTPGPEWSALRSVLVIPSLPLVVRALVQVVLVLVTLHGAWSPLVPRADCAGQRPTYFLHYHPSSTMLLTIPLILSKDK